MPGLNEVRILGYVTKDPALEYVGQQKIPKLTLYVATTKYGKTQDGVKTEHTEFHMIQVWRKTAENCIRYLTKGSLVFVEGELKTDTWEKDGKKNYRLNIVARDVQFLNTKPREAQPEQQPANFFGNADVSSADPLGDIPF